MTRNQLFILSFIILFVSQLSFAQNDSIAIKDSINLSEVRIQNNRLVELEKQRISDSLKKVELEQQILSLSSTDDVKRQQLNAQIALLKEKEEQLTDIKKRQIAALKKTAKGFPAMGLFEDTLFLIHNRLGSFSASERADAVSRRIKNLQVL